MRSDGADPMTADGKQPDNAARPRRRRRAPRPRRREQGYRERALKIYPWICGRCAREFTAHLRELTVHHRDHNHDNNPPDGSNWELLCLYCHDNEHQRQLEHAQGIAAGTPGNGAASRDAQAVRGPRYAL